VFGTWSLTSGTSPFAARPNANVACSGGTSRR
jgi:hypothetical protein